MYKLRVFSPNHSCAPLRGIMMNNRVLFRFGSTTPLVSKYKYLEINSIEGVKNSSNKIKTKKIFDECGIKHSEWINSNNKNDLLRFFNEHKIVIIKHKHSSKGKGIYFADNIDDFNKIINSINIKDHIVEKFYFYPSEFRLHVDINNGCFYACKKVFKEDAEDQWHKHANNSTFVRVTQDIKIPACWDDIVKDCITSLKAIGLTIGCFDVLACNNNYIIVESNSAPSLANYGLTYYMNHLIKYYGNR